MIDQPMGGGRGEVDEEGCQDNAGLETASLVPPQDGEVVLMAFIIPLLGRRGEGREGGREGGRKRGREVSMDRWKGKKWRNIIV